MQTSISLNLTSISFTLISAVSYLNDKPSTGKSAMPDPNQPQEYDAVLGGESPISAGSAILGGIEGVKRLLASQVEEQRIAALSEALKYGEAGLDLVIRALQNESEQVEKAAYLLLKESAEPKVKQALQEGNPWRFFECLRTLDGGSYWVPSFAISPDGQTLVIGSLVIGSRDNTIKIWHLQTGELIRTIAGHSSYVNCVAISPDGQTLVSGSHDKTIKIWHLQTGELIRTFEGHSSRSFAISPDGKTLVSGSDDKTIKIWHLQTGELIRTIAGHSFSVNCVAISPDGQTLVSGSDDHTIKIWHLQTGKLKKTIEGHSLKGHSSYVNCVAISPDGKTIVSGSGENPLCLFTSSENGSGPRPLTVFDTTIKVWNLHTGELIRTIEGHSSSINSVAISPDGKTIVSGSWDETIKIWGVP